jgi:hypothetical protein
MKSRADVMIEILQKRFPDVSFFWQKTPGSFLDMTPCTLAAFFNDSPKDIFTLDFTTGISEHNIEEQIQGIIDHFIPKLMKSRQSADRKL